MLEHPPSRRKRKGKRRRRRGPPSPHTLAQQRHEVREASGAKLFKVVFSRDQICKMVRLGYVDEAKCYDVIALAQGVLLLIDSIDEIDDGDKI